MAEQNAWLQAIQSLRDEMNQQHGRNSQRLDTLASEVNHGFGGLRGEMQVQNGRVRQAEKQIAVIENSIKPLQNAVYGLIALVCSSVVIGILGLVLK